MFVPTVEFLISLDTMSDWRALDGINYCSSAGRAYEPLRHPKSRHAVSPEANTREAALYWLRFADFYQWPLVQTFASWDELITKLDATDFDSVHASMLRENDRRKEELVSRWRSVIAKIEPSRRVPATYQEALERVVRYGSVQAK
jgi:hypothetical protein